MMANVGGDLHAEGSLSDVGQTAWHVGSGAFVGGLTGGTEGAIGSAAGNLLADLAFKALAPDKPKGKMDADEWKRYQEGLDRTAFAAKLFAPITIALATNGNAAATSSAISTSSRVIEENHHAHARAGLTSFEEAELDEQEKQEQAEREDAGVKHWYTEAREKAADTLIPDKVKAKMAQAAKEREQLEALGMDAYVDQQYQPIRLVYKEQHRGISPPRHERDIVKAEIIDEFLILTNRQGAVGKVMDMTFAAPGVAVKYTAKSLGASDGTAEAYQHMVDDAILVGGLVSGGTALGRGVGRLGRMMRGSEAAGSSSRIGAVGTERVSSLETVDLPEVFVEKKLLPAPTHTPYAGGFMESFVTTQEEVYYRVYSGDATKGRFLTKIPPETASLAQEGLALPSTNKAEFLQEVLVPKGTRLQKSVALPAFEKRGGMEQFEILHREDVAKVTYKTGVKLDG